MKSLSVISGLSGLCVMLAVGAELPVPPPAPPLPTSPVAVFRRLLSLDAAARALALAQRDEAHRSALASRLAEYDALPLEQREQRLLATDLYWHMQQLLPRPPAERSGLVANAPAPLQAVLSERLALWDRLPTSDREALLQHEQAIRYFAHMREITPPPLPITNASVAAAPAVPLRMQAELGRIQELSAPDRRHLVETWRQLFEATPDSPERNTALRSMTALERREMNEVLERFRALPPAQRQICIESFARFATMKPSERVGFLRDAERWASLPAQERQAWRNLVTKLPPLPPIPESIPPPPLPGPTPKAQLLTGGKAPH